MHKLKIKKYHFIDNFDYNKLKNLNREVCLIWRSKKIKENLKLIEKTASYCKKNRIKFFLANNFKLAIKLDLDGVYISAYNKEIFQNCYSFKKKFRIIGSAHNIYEIGIKKRQMVKEIFFSPIFKNNQRKALGINKLKIFFEYFNGEKIALGGINKTNLKLLKLRKFTGFAAIKYFE